MYDGNGALVTRFEYAAGRMPAAMETGGATYYLAYDQVGSLRAVIDTAGTVVKEIEYDSFGVILDDSNLTFHVPIGFAGGLHDRDTGLARFGFRDYDPAVGRWTAKDPIGFDGGDTNLYAYVANNPVSYTDPSGLYIDTALDVGFIAWDIRNIILDPCNKDNWIALGLDTIGLLIPGVTGLGIAYKGARYGARAGNAVRRVDTALGLCFVAGTAVLTPEGEVPIEELAPGDTVYTMASAGDELAIGKVVQTFETPDQRVLEIELEDEDGTQEIIRATGQHPFWVVEEGWTEAQDLLCGQQIATSSGAYLRVGNKTWAQDPQTVYNFEVAGTHSYFVGQVGAWVHNMCAASPSPTLWPSAFGKGVSKGRASQNGVEFSVEALERMAPRGLGGRGVPPSVVRDVIANGSKIPGNTAGTTVHILNNVQVVTANGGKTIVTVIH